MATVSVGWLPDPLSPSLAPLSPASIVMVEARSADNEDSKGVVDVVKDVVVRIEDVEDDKAVNSDDSEDVGRNVGFDVEAKNFELDEVVKLEMAMSDATKEEAVSFSSNVEAVVRLELMLHPILSQYREELICSEVRAQMQP